MGDNMPICKALLKYGKSAFTLEIIEYCEAETRFGREAYYLKLFKPEYNIIYDVTPFSADTILKMSENQPRSEKISVLDLVSNSIIEYNFIRHVASSFGLNRVTVVNYLNSFISNPYLDRYVFERVDKLGFSSVNVRSSIIKVEYSLAKIGVSLNYIQNKLAQIKAFSYISKEASPSETFLRQFQRRKLVL
jgi:hypothetical protein